MEEKRIRVLLQMAATLHLSVRRGEQCELESASHAVLAGHSYKGHSLATPHGSRDRCSAHPPPALGSVSASADSTTP